MQTCIKYEIKLMCCLKFYLFVFTSFSVLTVGFNQTTYTVNEGAGFVNTTISVLNGTLARNVYVTVFTSDATASSTGG